MGSSCLLHCEGCFANAINQAHSHPSELETPTAMTFPYIAPSLNGTSRRFKNG